jgi:hypothetical protein
MRASGVREHPSADTGRLFPLGRFPPPPTRLFPRLLRVTPHLPPPLYEKPHAPHLPRPSVRMGARNGAGNFGGSCGGAVFRGGLRAVRPLPGTAYKYKLLDDLYVHSIIYASSYLHPV